MTDITTALNELGVTEWVLRGEPTTQDEFETMFRKVMGADANGSAIESSDNAGLDPSGESSLRSVYILAYSP